MANVPGVEGKVFFISNNDSSLEGLLNLRLVERVFLVIHRENYHLTSEPFTEGRLIALVKQQMPQIQHAFSIWKERFYKGNNCEVHSRKRRHSSTKEDLVSPTNDQAMGVDIRVRVSIKLTGSCRSINPDNVRAEILSSWNLKGYKIVENDSDVTLNIMCSDALVMLGVQLSPLPLSLRSYIKSFGLRSTTCAAMGLLANIQPGEIVLDPMCGVGSVMLEVSNKCPQAMYIGIDIEESQIQKSNSNEIYYREVVRHSPLHLQLLLGDARNTSLRDSSIDVILTDLPFGQKHTVSGSMQGFYLRCCKEFFRLLDVRGRGVVLTSKYLLDSLRTSCEKAQLHITEEHYVTLGRTEAYIVCFHK